MTSGLLSNRWRLVACHTVLLLVRASWERVCSGHVQVPSGFPTTRDRVIVAKACVPVRLGSCGGASYVAPLPRFRYQSRVLGGACAVRTTLLLVSARSWGV